MNNKEATIPKETAEQQECRHYWVIKPVAIGRISTGVCKLCGTQKEFGNYITDCVDLEKEGYLEWGGSQRREKKGPDPVEEVFAEIKGGSKSAAKAIA